MTIAHTCFAVVFLAQLVQAGVHELPNGGVWKDTDGVMINAHGGALMKDGKTWYWYGEHKTASR